MILYDKKCFFPQFPGIDLTAFSIIKDYTNFQFIMISVTARRNDDDLYIIRKRLPINFIFISF